MNLHENLFGIVPFCTGGCRAGPRSLGTCSHGVAGLCLLQYHKENGNYKIPGNFLNDFTPQKKNKMLVISEQI